MIHKKYIFNPYYTLKNDGKRIVLLNSSNYRIPEIAEESVSVYLHPTFAILFSLFDGVSTLDICLKKISNIFNSTEEQCYKFIQPFIENPQRVGIEYSGWSFEFPKNILLDNTNHKYNKRDLNYSDFVIEGDLDFKTVRLFEAPTSINFLITTKCITDCIYCYVQRDKKIDCQIPIEKICSIIDEAKRLNIINFDISGTEFFMYEKWEIVLDKLLKNGYYPYLSTKIPLTEDTLRKIKALGMNDFQFSIDTSNINSAMIVNNIKDKDYLSKMFKSLKYAGDIGLKTTINTVITRYNSNHDELKMMLDNISHCVNIEKVMINPAEASLYCPEKRYNDYKLSIKEINDIENFIDDIRDTYDFEIKFAGYEDIKKYKDAFDLKEERFWKRSICTGNISQFCILPDGQVTICEELYWQQRFIIGNILESSISEIWKSTKALDLYYLSQEAISEKSPCKKCKSFTYCRQNIGVCWSDILTAYGPANWDFPPSDCPYSPFPYHSIYHE